MEYNEHLMDDELPVGQTCPDTPFQAFLEYLNLDFWSEVANQSNLYSVQQRDHHSINTNSVEIIQFAGIHVLMGTLKYPQVRMYWSDGLSIPSISEAMPRNRYFQLQNHLHFADNSVDHTNDSDKLWKIRLIIDAFREKCVSLPRSNHLSIDEQMIPFAGRCAFRQYLPSKPNPLGLKNFVLAARDGLVLDFRIYQGKGTVPDEDTKKIGLGGSVVKLLTNTVPKDGKHVIYTDRFFTGVKTADELLQLNIHLTGTVMCNRVGSVSKKLKSDKELKQRGEWEEWLREDEKVCVVKWKDNKSVTLLSTCIGSEPVQQCQRWSKEQKKRISVPQPAIVGQYNLCMGGTDLCDRYLAYYRCATRTKKWTTRVFNHFLDLVIVNCWVMYRRKCNEDGVPKKETMSLLNYRLDLGLTMVRYEGKASVSVRPRGRPSAAVENDSDDDVPCKKQRRVVPQPQKDIRLDNIGHLPTYCDDKNASKCRLQGCKSRSRIMCVKCGVYLCVLKNNCFLKFHSS